MVYGLSAGALKPGSYDRYTPFKLYPEADYICIAWPMGLVQISKNPFKKAVNPYHLADIAWSVMNKYKSKLSVKISLADVKRQFEGDIRKGKTMYAPRDTMNFQFTDFVNLFGKQINVQLDSGFGKVLQNISKKDYKWMSAKQKAVLENVKISVWDIIKASSGGHKDITNISGFGFYPDDYVPLLKKIWKDMGKEMRNKHLQEG